MRHFDHEAGLEPFGVWSVAQDSTGLLWIGTVGGLYRHDGVTTRRWAPEVLYDQVSALAASRDGRLLVLSVGRLYEVIGDSARTVFRSEGEPFTAARAVTFVADGTAVVVDGNRLWRETSAGRWVAVDLEHVEVELRPFLSPNATAGVDFSTGYELWSLGKDSPPVFVTRIADLVQDVVSFEDGRRIVLAGGRVLEVAGERVTELLSLDARGIALARRGDVVWALFDRFLAALRPGQAPEVIGAREGFDGGGVGPTSLLVDHERGLWLGTFNGLLYYPEPETVFWGERHGLPMQVTQFLARTDEGLWVTTWEGTGLLREVAGGWSANTLHALPSQERVHMDRHGVLWIATSDGLHELRNGRRLRDHPPMGWIYSVWEPENGPLWLGLRDGLVRVDPESGVPDPVEGLPFPQGRLIRGILEDRAGRFWVASGREICRAPGPPVPGAHTSWFCETAPGERPITALVELPSGAIWASSELGVFCWDGNGWSSMPGNARLASRALRNLAHSRTEGVWILGHGVAQRVVERDGGCDDWQTLESLSSWHGLPGGRVHDVLEEEDGTLWLTTTSGVARMPPAARFSERRPPRVVVVDVRVDDEPVSAPLRLPHHRNGLELQFAALSFRTPNRIRYQIRLAPDSVWTEARTAPAFRWVDLSPGTYRAEVRASLDGQSWSAEPAVFEFEVMAPWYVQVWSLVAFTLLLAATLVYAHKRRVRRLLELERIRTRIAADLHDDLGASLARVSLLSEATRRALRDKPEHAERMVDEIGTTSRELVTAAGDIAFSIDPGRGRLDGLVARLRRFTEDLLADTGIDWRFTFDGEMADAVLSSDQRRHLLAIVKEALHNAVRHARPRHVSLTLALRGDVLVAELTDDGCGFRTDASGNGRASQAGRKGRGRQASRRNGREPEAGHGLRNIRDRARELGAHIEIHSHPGGGTRVALHCPLRSRPRTIMR